MSIPKPSLYYHLYGSLSKEQNITIKQYYNRRFVIVVSRTLFKSQNIYFEIIFSHQYICINLLLQLPIIDNNLVILKYMYLVLSLSLLNNRIILIEYFISIFIPYPIYKIMV